MSDLPKPNCRIEQHLNAIATGDLTQLPDKDYSRVEQYLRYIALNGGTGEGLTADQKEKLNKIDVLGAQMVDITNHYYESDNTVGNDIPTNKKFSLEELQHKQNFLLGDFYRKLRKGEFVKIVCQGDSMTYGHDTTSTNKRPAKSDKTLDNYVTDHTFTQAQITYPEAMQNYMNEVYGENKVKIINRGFSGDSVKKGYERWNIPNSESNLTIFSYGTNDSRAEWVDYKGDLKIFLSWYEKLIAREILRGNAVILITPFKQRTSNDLNVDTFSDSLVYLGKKYNVPVVISDEFTINQSSNIHSDDTHFNDIGYSVVASRLMSLFMGEGLLNIKKVYDSSKLLTRKTIDNIQYNNAVFGNSTGYCTPDEIISNQGIALNMKKDSVVYYSFYCETDDLLIIPDIYVYKSSARFTLDFGVQQQCYSISTLTGGGLYYEDKKPRNTFTITDDKANVYCRTTRDMNNYYIHVATKGWHTLKIDIPQNTNSCALRGIEFISYNNFSINTSHKKQFIKISTHDKYDSTEDVTSTSVNLSEIYNTLNLTEQETFYWLSETLKVRIYNWGNSILEYVIALGSVQTPQSFVLCKDFNRYRIIDEPTAERTLETIKYDATTKSLIFNWGGRTNRAATFMITL